LVEAGSGEAWGKLMAAAQDGDRAAYARLLAEIVPYVRAVARRHHATADRQDDVVQDVLLTLHQIRHTYDPTRPFLGWLAAIAHRRSVDALRRRVRTGKIEAHAPIAYETFADPQANEQRANEGISAGEDSVRLGAAIATLPAGQRQAVELLRLKELSLAEAAEVSGQSVGALKVSLHRAIGALRKKFAVGGLDSEGES
jgi:RNA polymerase sigma-70 factor (ECF subfamily)